MNPSSPPPAPREPSGGLRNPELAPAYAHPGPPEGWRPMSGLCLSAFILALVLSLVALVSLWPGVLLPLVLGCLAVLRVDGARYRGRGLAWSAVVISAVFGVVGYGEARAMGATSEQLASGVVQALRAVRPPEERDRLLNDWLLPGPDRDVVRKRIQQRYEDALQRAGPQTGDVELPSVWAGWFPFVIPPDGVRPVDDPTAKDALPQPMTALWVRVPFANATLHLALSVGDGSHDGFTEGLKRLAAGGSAPILRDARFFAGRNAVLASPAPVAPPTPEAPLPPR